MEGTRRLCSPPTASIYSQGDDRLSGCHRVGSDLRDAEGGGEDPVRRHQGARAPGQGPRALLHVLEGVSDAADGDDVGELAMAGLLPTVDPAHLASTLEPSIPGGCLARGHHQEAQERQEGHLGGETGLPYLCSPVCRVTLYFPLSCLLAKTLVNIFQYSLPYVMDHGL